MAGVNADTRSEAASIAGSDWQSLYQSEGPALMRYVQRLVGPTEAPDLTHECFIRAIRADRQPTRREEIRPWLYRIITNLALDALRRRRRWLFVPFDRARGTAAPATTESEIVRAALSAIAPDQAAALVLRLQERLSRAQIAEVMEISESAVKGRLVRGRLNFVAAYRRLGGMR